MSTTDRDLEFNALEIDVGLSNDKKTSRLTVVLKEGTLTILLPHAGLERLHARIATALAS